MDYMTAEDLYLWAKERGLEKTTDSDVRQLR